VTNLKRALSWMAAAAFALAAAVANAQPARVDVNARAADGTTGLYWAAAKNDLEAAKRFVAGGADVSIASRYGVTPLSLAALNGNAALIRMLLEAGADPNTSLPDGETALMTAARTGVVDAVNVLLAAGARLDAKEQTHGQTALMWAAAEGHVDTIKTLMAHGADIHARSTAGWTAWLFAVREGRMEAVRTLLDAGAKIDDTVPSTDGRRRPGGSAQEAPSGPGALHLAVGSNHFELAAYLLDRGANPNASGPGWTALHHITWMRKPGQGSNGPGPKGSGRLDSLELVRKLAAHGANLNARVTRRPNAGTTALNLIGGTPFFLAARTADFEMMRVLAELGADPRLPNEDGTTPLMAAAGAGTHSPGEDPGTEAEALEAVKLALALGNDLNAVDKNGNTAMHGAAYKQLPSVVDLLVANGARIDVWNRKNVMGWTPLRIAVGVHRGMNFRFHEATAERLRRVMTAAGVSTVVDPERVISGGTPTKN
jgi:uncharacterized protein